MVFISKIYIKVHSRYMYVTTTQMYVYTSLCAPGKMQGHRDVYGVVVGSARWVLRQRIAELMDIHICISSSMRIRKRLTSCIFMLNILIRTAVIKFHRGFHLGT